MREGVKIMESAKFLRSLEHNNLRRPKFSIKLGGSPMLEIVQGGQVMQVPMGEILIFVRRWQADHDAQRPARVASGRLDLFPYPLENTNLNDPDCLEVRWDCPE